MMQTFWVLSLLLTSFVILDKLNHLSLFSFSFFWIFLPHWLLFFPTLSWNASVPKAAVRGPLLPSLGDIIFWWLQLLLYAC